MKSLTITKGTTEQIEAAAIIPALYARYFQFIDATQKTAETYGRNLRHFVDYINAHGVTQPTRQTVLAYRDELKATKKPATVHAYITAVRLFFAWTAQEGLYPNIADHVKGAKIDAAPKKDYLTAAQIKAILSQIDTTAEAGKRDYAMLFLMTVCGLRTVEVSRANIEDLRPLAGFTALYVQGKGHEEKADYVKVPAEVEKAIRVYLQSRKEKDGSAPLFGSVSNQNHGERMTTRSISRIAKEAFKAAGYDSERITAHSLRHTAVTLALLAGEDITAVQEFARHKNIATTLIYSHALDKAKNNCAASIAAAML